MCCQIRSGSPVPRTHRRKGGGADAPAWSARPPAARQFAHLQGSRASSYRTTAGDARCREPQPQEREARLIMLETLSSLQDLKDAAAPAPEAAPRYVQKLDPQGRAYATGKRKDAVAQVWIKPGPGKALVNGKPLDSYFARPVLRMILRQAPGGAQSRGQKYFTGSVGGGGGP